jgi:hypothetical protein
MRLSFKHYILGLFLFLALLYGAQYFFFRPKPEPPLPFDSTVFISTAMPTYGALTPPPNAGVWERLRISVFELLLKIDGKRSSTWTFGPGAKTPCSIQGLLNQCMEVSSNRYLMPLGVAAGTVQFGHTNALDGAHWVAAFETALQEGDVQVWDEQTKRTHAEHLTLLRFPPQKTVVVLPQSAVADFLRTNGIQMPEGKGK